MKIYECPTVGREVDVNPKASQTITLRQLRAFIAVARERSFTRASEAVHLTQPALTTCVRQLEDRIGVPLLDRTTRHVGLNLYGESFLPAAERIVRDLDAAIEACRALQEGSEGSLSIATVPSIASSILPEAIATFSTQSPRVGFELFEDHSEGVRRKVQEGEAEIGLSGVTEAFPGIEARPNFFDTVGLFCRSDHPFALLDRPLVWADLAGQEIFNMGYQTQIQSIVEVVPELEISLSAASYKVRNTLATLSLIRSRNAVAALPRLSIPLTALGDVVFRPLGNPELKRDVYLCRQERTPLSPLARRFIALTRTSARTAGAELYEWSADDPSDL